MTLDGKLRKGFETVALNSFIYIYPFISRWEMIGPDKHSFPGLRVDEQHKGGVDCSHICWVIVSFLHLCCLWWLMTELYFLNSTSTAVRHYELWERNASMPYKVILKLLAFTSFLFFFFNQLGNIELKAFKW